MKEFRENPDGEKNQKLTKENQRAVFAAQQMYKKQTKNHKTKKPK